MSELRVESWTLPAANLGPENPLPPIASVHDLHAELKVDASVPVEERELLGWGAPPGLLPYRLLDGYDRSRTPRAFQVVVLENEFLRVGIDPKSGCIVSLFDKRSGTEALAPNSCGTLLQTFVDKPKEYDAWNIDADFEKQHWDLSQADEVTLAESGPLRAVIRVKNHFQNSTFIRDITMYAGVPRVDVKMQAEWHEKHILLKVAFPLSVSNDLATFEIPYGSIERPTTSFLSCFL